MDNNINNNNCIFLLLLLLLLLLRELRNISQMMRLMHFTTLHSQG